MPDEEKSDENLLDEKNAMESSQLGGVSRPRAARPRRHPLLAPCQELTLHFGVVLELGDKSLFISPWKPHLTRVIAACCYQWNQHHPDLNQGNVNTIRIHSRRVNKGAFPILWTSEGESSS